MSHFANDAIERFRYLFVQFVAEQLKLLLETKHLYQKVSLAPDEINKKLLQGMAQIVGERENFMRFVQAYTVGSFTVTDKPLINEQTKHPIMTLIVGNVKLFCSDCDAREAFRPIWLSDITGELVREKTNHQKSLPQETFKISFRRDWQLFSLVFQCQRCQGLPETFLIKRRELDLFIEGRSPIEHVEVPSYIPKQEKHWFRDALVAFQSGKILAGLFYLRTFIEQFARRKTNLEDEKRTGEEIMAAYIKTLPENLRDAMPSLGEWYEKISGSLHGANEDSELFENARQRIEKHFDIRRVHDLEN